MSFEARQNSQIQAFQTFFIYRVTSYGGFHFSCHQLNAPMTTLMKMRKEINGPVFAKAVTPQILYAAN